MTEAIPLRDYFATRENRTDVDGLGFSEEELARDVLVVDYDARFEGGTKGEAFLFDRTLQRRGADGRITIVGRQSEPQTLDAADDSCGCFDYFFLRGRGAEYRVVIEVKRPNAPNADPIQRRESDWFQGLRPGLSSLPPAARGGAPRSSRCRSRGTGRWSRCR